MNLLDLLRVINLLTVIHKSLQDYFSAQEQSPIARTFFYG